MRSAPVPHHVSLTIAYLKMLLTLNGLAIDWTLVVLNTEALEVMLHSMALPQDSDLTKVDSNLPS